MSSRTFSLALVLASVLSGLESSRAQSPDVAAELEEAKALYRQGRYDRAVSKLQGAIARLERLRDLEVQRAQLADACLQLGFSYVALGDRAAARAAFKSVASLDQDRRLDPQVYGASVVALFEEARGEAGIEAATGRAPGPSGILSVSSDVWIDISVDSGASQETPLSMRLPVGRHVVRASRPGYRPRVIEVEIGEGDARRLQIALEREGGVR